MTKQQYAIRGEGFFPAVGGFSHLWVGDFQFTREQVQDIMLASLDEALAVRKPSDIEVIAERLAKVEDRLVELRNHDSALHGRIDGVVEIIGERVSGLVDEIAAVRDSAKRAHERLDVHEIAFHYVYKALDQVMLRSGFGNMSSEYPLTPAFPNAPAFPTGGASTAEAAAEAVLPVPQRGDRVRLEGLDRNDDALGNGWYDVVGRDDDNYTQISAGFDKRGVKRLYRVENHLIKEVRHADHT